MAGTLALNVEILGAFNNLTAATNGAAGQLQGLSGKVSTISSGIRNALGAIGVGFSLGFLKRELTEAAKAAVDEAKSMEILSIAMQNTGLATKETVTQAEAAIKKMSLQSAVADDKLRPAYQKLFIATGNVTDSNKYLQIALDASAATGKDLDSVTQAMAKSLAGQDTALLKLIPSLIGVQDPLAKLGETFAGAATAAANLDPFQRMNVAMGEIQESVGLALLPVLNDLADWFIDIVPDIQNFAENLVAALDDPQVKDSISEMQTSLGNLGVTIGTLFGSTETDEAKGFMNFWIVLSEIVQGLATGLNALLAPISSAFGNTKPMENYLDSLLNLIPGVGEYSGMIERRNAITPAPPVPPLTVTNNIQVRTDATAQEIANAINRANRASGTNLIRNFE
jgi:hypothetical protein